MQNRRRVFCRVAASFNKLIQQNLQRVSGLTDENRNLLFEKLVEVSGGQSEQNIYADAVLYQVRDELARVYDSDQLEVLDIYIEGEQIRRAQIDSISRGITNIEDYSSRFLANARASVNTNYGAFIRDLPLSPSEKQELRTAMVRVQVNNADRSAAYSSGQITDPGLLSGYLRMETELAKVLNEVELQAFSEFEQQKVAALRQATIDMQQMAVNENLKAISGLSEFNRRQFLEALAIKEPHPTGAGRYQPETIRSARDQIVSSLDSDQLELIDIFLAESIGFQRSVDEITQQRQGN